MAWAKGFNFRETSGFVTDGPNETYVLGEAYPTTRNGVTFGWDVAMGVTDRSASLDRRVAGVNFANVVLQIFRVDLPAAGVYTIELAVGDVFAWNLIHCTVKDSMTTVLNFSQNILAGHVYDATGTDYTHAAWPGSQTPVAKTFATTTLYMEMQSDAASFWTIQHLFINQISVSALPFMTTIGGQRFGY